MFFLQDPLTTTGLLSLSLAISCWPPSFLSISFFSLVGHGILSLSLVDNDSIFSSRKWPHPSPANPFPHRDCLCHSDRQWHRCKVHNTESPNFFFYNFFYSCNNITTGLFVENTGLFVECLCVCGIFFFILILVFCYRENVEKMPKNTSLTVILLRAKLNFHHSIKDCW